MPFSHPFPFLLFDLHLLAVCELLPRVGFLHKVIVGRKCLEAKNFGLHKYYRFKSGLPSHFPLLSIIFIDTYATGDMADASTQDLLDTPPKERGIEDPYIDLNSPCNIIEVEESENLSPSRQIPQGKGKRCATPMQSSWSSKWTATGDAAAEIDRMTGE
ncbi:uncharacterized protein LOC133881865 isoform X2 [Alnus glutinosa]|uniref:uncharacterized protein LOC133881865 isoform X2 n=1 Tax=Alnus glutinosa TaxID=3517 RepID=UPI002D770F33|nr:uncharacterized protein LOC133881865 isoform X2 [Alnus glutinosa]